VRSAANPQCDIEIAITGARPGEKLFEELFYDPAQAEPTRQPKILRSRMQRHSNRDLEAGLARLQTALQHQDEAELRLVLFELIND